MRMVDSDIMSLLIAVEKVWNTHLEEHENTDLQHYFPLSITITSHGEHIATLYEEGWDFDPPKVDTPTLTG